MISIVGDVIIVFSLIWRIQFVTSYGVDVTAPIHHMIDKEASHFAKRYYDTMQGCYDKYTKQECDSTEWARLRMNKAQPATQHNYTSIGFKKLRAPIEAWEPLIAFYEQNKNKKHPENWSRGNTYVNHWDSPSEMVSFEDRSLRGGLNVKERIWAGVKPILEEWTGKQLVPTSLYGIRVYQDGAILATHVDRLPLVTSCIIQVSQDLDEDWPIEVYDHDGQAHNVTMKPGDMVLYESHTVLHGRPFPLKGRHYANVFVHFQPVDHDVTNQLDIEERKKQEESSVKPFLPNFDFFTDNIKERLFSARKKYAGHENDNHSPDHLAEIVKELKAGNVHEPADSPRRVSLGESLADEDSSPENQLHLAASVGDLIALQSILKDSNDKLLHSKDDNDWQAIHEAVRGGHLDCVKFLISKGADLSSRVADGGASLWLARRFLLPDDPVIEYLISIGAPEDEEL